MYKVTLKSFIKWAPFFKIISFDYEANVFL
jgi:hypothetical protein